MGQRPHPGRRPGRLSGRRGASHGLTMVAIFAVIGAPLLTGCSSSVSAAPTTVRGVLAASVVHLDGSSRPATEGLKLQPGDVVRTAAGGRAELVTDNRIVYVGSQAAVQVVDGDHQVLRAGALVADAQRGPGLHAEVGGLSVDIPGGAAVRAERSVTARIGALAGSAQVVSSAGRRLIIGGLHQALVGGDALPDVATALRLTDDDGEAHAVPALVRDDETLNGLARGIDATGPSTARVVEAGWDGPLSAPRSVGRSERLLPAVIAAAGPTADAHARYQQAVDYRKAGGSWGVIARLLAVRAQSVVATLAAFERTQPPGQVGSVAAVLASVGGNRTGTDRGTGGRDITGPVTRHGNSTGRDKGNGNGTADGGSPTPSPAPSGPVGTLVGTVDSTVGQVLSLLPTPTPTPSRNAGPLPVPLPSLLLPTLPLPKVTSLPLPLVGH